jgi:hypothetical protein
LSRSGSAAQRPSEDQGIAVRRLSGSLNGHTRPLGLSQSLRGFGAIPRPVNIAFVKQTAFIHEGGTSGDGLHYAHMMQLVKQLHLNCF